MNEPAPRPRSFVLTTTPAKLGGPLCPHCNKPKTPGWTETEANNGWRFNEQTNTREYHCYERYCD